MDRVPISVFRGGSSKGAYVLADDLPADPDARNDLLRRIMGSPDPRQVDGIGGAHPLTSKVAIVGPSSRADVDVEYLFLQVGVDTPMVTDRQNCGNLLAGVGPFALEAGLISTHGDPNQDQDQVSVRILMRNTDTVATARFSVADGLPVYSGTTAISGVPGTASPIHLDFEDLAGGSCGSMLPTGNTVDVVCGVACTLIDNGMPVIVLNAGDLGVTGTESPAELEADETLRLRLEAIRLEAGPLMHLGDVSGTIVPKITMVSAPQGDGHLSTRTFIPHRCHEAIGVLGAVSVATAALLAGSPANAVLSGPVGDTIRLEHPSGHFDAVIEVRTTVDGSIEVDRAGIVRTARKLMDGMCYPRPADEPSP